MSAAPADRRSFLGSSLALASTIAASAVPAAADAAQPDATLLAACAAFIVGEMRWVEIDRFGTDALNRYIAPPVPPVPPALLHQPVRDTWEICHDPRCLDGIKIDGEWRKFHASEEDVASLRWKVNAWRKHGTGGNLVERAEEIITALDAYVPAVRQAEDAAGVTTFDDMTEENETRLRELLHQIASTPATTMQGIIAEARAATFEMGGAEGLDWLSSDHLPRLLAEEHGSEVFQRHTLALVMSVIVDAARLGVTALDEAAA